MTCGGRVRRREEQRLMSLKSLSWLESLQRKLLVQEIEIFEIYENKNTDG